ncbi:dienelactone hydrolase family protein [Rhodococcus sp. IEGM 1370]|uniref:alpha/beta hydrolase n=1 Tax=Rhodococcus sp. IEGM 1370 TaxID=3082222 RepID=UPI002953BCAA|nr:dienelactone hydrolase family protein [Rhodococcus sp. IEGM 1370]MDV8079743.1 dienelactone hydrolase family protein [Rhodococcus sp. IEGM 1370]
MGNTNITERNPHLRRPLQFHGAADLASARLVVYAIHGRGQQPSYMAQVADRVGLDGIAYVLPAAADATWYPARFTDSVDANQPSLGNALDAVSTHLQWLIEQGVTPERTVVVGFSQGACLLAEHLLRTQIPYAGAAILTGGYIGPAEHQWPRRIPGLMAMPTLLTTAARDEWVPLPRVHATAEAFTDLAADAELHVYNDPEHHVSDIVVEHLRALLERAASNAS